MSWQSFKQGCRREAIYFLLIVGSGAGLVVMSLLLLTLFPTWDSGSKMTALIGARIIMIGYPAFIIIRFVVWLFKRK